VSVQSPPPASNYFFMSQQDFVTYRWTFPSKHRFCGIQENLWQRSRDMSAWYKHVLVQKKDTNMCSPEKWTVSSLLMASSFRDLGMIGLKGFWTPKPIHDCGIRDMSTTMIMGLWLRLECDTDITLSHVAGTKTLEHNQRDTIDN
jgi:hypothetical protein